MKQMVRTGINTLTAQLKFFNVIHPFFSSHIFLDNLKLFMNLGIQCLLDLKCSALEYHHNLNLELKIQNACISSPYELSNKKRRPSFSLLSILYYIPLISQPYQVIPYYCYSFSFYPSEQFVLTYYFLLAPYHYFSFIQNLILR